MARDMMARRLRAWLDFFAMPGVVDAMRRNSGPNFRWDEIENGARALNLDPASDTDLGILLGILADVCFPTLQRGPHVNAAYRAPDPPLVSIWTSARYSK
jgi:hypothetical protein